MAVPQRRLVFKQCAQPGTPAARAARRYQAMAPTGRRCVLTCIFCALRSSTRRGSDVSDRASVTSWSKAPRHARCEPQRRLGPTPRAHATLTEPPTSSARSRAFSSRSSAGVLLASSGGGSHGSSRTGTCLAGTATLRADPRVASCCRAGGGSLQPRRCQPEQAEGIHPLLTQRWATPRQRPARRMRSAAGAARPARAAMAGGAGRTPSRRPACATIACALGADFRPSSTHRERALVPGRAGPTGAAARCASEVPPADVTGRDDLSATAVAAVGTAAVGTAVAAVPAAVPGGLLALRRACERGAGSLVPAEGLRDGTAPAPGGAGAAGGVGSFAVAVAASLCEGARKSSAERRE
jgi:hypothetical protein